MAVYKEISDGLTSKTGNQQQKMDQILAEYEQDNARVKREISQNKAVQLVRRSFSIENEDY